MMLSKSSSSSRDEVVEDGRPKPLDAVQKAQEVADLERRLKDLSSSSSTTTATPSPGTAVAIPTPAPGVGAGAGGKNALLARIMAAQERAKQHNQPTPPAPPSFDAVAPPAFATRPSPPPPPSSSFAVPPLPTTFAPPPPSFDVFAATTTRTAPPPPAVTTALPPPPPSFDFLDAMMMMGTDNNNTAIPPPPPPPPPAFDASHVPQPQQSAPAYGGFTAMMPPPEAPSAPSFDLLMMDPAAPPAVMMPPPPPPAAAAQQLDDETMQMILAMEGMSDADKQSLIQEQLKILQSIEAKKKSNVVSAADAFEQRSFSAAVRAVGNTSGGGLHGPERTRMALANGSAVVMVRCAACDTISQVTGAAQFMFCPTCQTVTPVIGGTDDNDTTMTAASMSDLAQMEADAQLAQELQKEEYESADRQEERRLRAAEQQQRQRTTTATSSTNAASGSWMDWLGFGGSSTTPAAAPVTRTSTEAVQFDHHDHRATGQTAGPAPLFACVTDSINSAANYALSLPQDDEGNVHGVDSSSLLAVPQVGRNNNTNNSKPSSSSTP